MARRLTPLLKQQRTASALTGLMLIRACAVHGASGLHSMIKQCLYGLRSTAGGYRCAHLYMLTDMPYRYIGFTK